MRFLGTAISQLSFLEIENSLVFIENLELIADASALFYRKFIRLQTNMQTRLFRIIRQLLLNSQDQLNQFQQVLTTSILYLFIGFITGSAFCTILSINKPFPDALVIFFLLFLFEKIGKLVYQPRKKQITLYKLINCWKTGLLLGFFIDAFKVGS